MAVDAVRAKLNRIKKQITTGDVSEANRKFYEEIRGVDGTESTAEVQMALAANHQRVVDEQVASYCRDEKHNKKYMFPYYWLALVYLSQPCLRINMVSLAFLSSEVGRKDKIVGNIVDLEKTSRRKNKNKTPSTGGSTDDVVTKKGKSDSSLTVNYSVTESLEEKVRNLEKAKNYITDPNKLQDIDNKIAAAYSKYVDTFEA
jgi:hypothetical protein